MPAGATMPIRAGCFRSSADTVTSAAAEIGAIRIAANESYFQVSERATPGFIKALRRATIAPEDQGLVIEPAPPREQGSTYRPELAHEKPRPRKKPRKPKQA